MTATSALAAIETSYAGCRFRSRLEARWAVFFDQLNISWEYEAQGYEVDGRRYLPDFQIKAPDPLLVEVKGEESRIDTDLLAGAVRATTLPLLILGPVPTPDRTAPYVHRFILPLADCCEGGPCPSWEAAAFQSNGLIGVWTTSERFGRRWNTSGVVHSKVEDAYEAARSARFEHGETPERRVFPSRPTGDQANFRPTIYMLRVAYYLEQQENGATIKMIENNVAGRTISIRRAIQFLVDENFIEVVESGNFVHYVLLRPFGIDHKRADV